MPAMRPGPPPCAPVGAAAGSAAQPRGDCVPLRRRPLASAHAASLCDLSAAAEIHGRRAAVSPGTRYLGTRLLRAPASSCRASNAALSPGSAAGCGPTRQPSLSHMHSRPPRCRPAAAARRLLITHCALPAMPWDHSQQSRWVKSGSRWWVARAAGCTQTWHRCTVAAAAGRGGSGAERLKGVLGLPAARDVGTLKQHVSLLRIPVREKEGQANRVTRWAQPQQRLQASAGAGAPLRPAPTAAVHPLCHSLARAPSSPSSTQGARTASRACSRGSGP